ncbi:MAG: tetratricopeptide repeat protein [Clostridia bacterium]
MATTTRRRNSPTRPWTRDESHGPAYDNLGQIQYRLGNYEEAESLLLKALDLKETMADSKYYLGMIYESWGETESARIALSPLTTQR